MSKSFPFCEDSVGLEIRTEIGNKSLESESPDYRYPHGDIRQYHGFRRTFFIDKENIDTVKFSGSEYFRLKRPYIKKYAFAISYIHPKDDKFRSYSRGKYGKQFLGYIKENQCIWVEVKDCNFQELLEYPEWTYTHFEEVKKKAEEMNKSAEDRLAAEQYNQEKMEMDHIEKWTTNTKNEPRKSIFRKIFNKLT